MIIPRLLFQAFYLFLFALIPPVLIFAFAYWLIPAQLTLSFMGTVAVIYILVVLAYMIFLYTLGIAGLATKSVSGSAPIDTSPENIQAMIKSLESQGFSHVGNYLTDIMFSKEPYLLYLNETKHVAAYIRIGNVKDAGLSYETIWDSGEVIITDLDATGFIIHKPHFRFTSVKGSVEAAYRYHLEQVKSLKETAGKSVKFESVNHFLDYEVRLMRIGAPEINYVAVAKVLPVFVGALIPVMAFAALPPTIAGYFNLLPEAATIEPYGPYALFIGMGALVFFVSPRLLNQNPFKALELESEEDAIFADDALA